MAVWRSNPLAAYSLEIKRSRCCRQARPPSRCTRRLSIAGGTSPARSTASSPRFSPRAAIHNWQPPARGMAESSIGVSVARRDGVPKVRGATRYAADVHLDGTLHGAILRSPYPYARIVRIDTAAASRVPGVHAVLSGLDIPERLAGRSLADVPVLCRDMVRFIGDRVAAVAAESVAAAQRALALIVVEYAELEPVFV